MTDATPTRRSFYPTPAWLILALLVVECVLWLSERFQWPAWHKGYAVLTALAAVGVVFVAMLLWFAASLIFHWTFQFSIRSLLVLTVAVALPYGWLSLEMKAAREEHAAVAWVAKLHGWTFYAYQWPNTTPTEPEWLRRLLGEEFFSDVVALMLVREFASSDHGHADTSGNPDSPDVGLSHIAGLTQLRDLLLDHSSISDAGLRHLERLTQLEDLDLSCTEVTDRGLEHIKGLDQLELLDLSNTLVTDAGLEALKGMNRLQHLHLHQTKVTAEGVKKLQQALPECEIVR